MDLLTRNDNAPVSSVQLKTTEHIPGRWLIRQCISGAPAGGGVVHLARLGELLQSNAGQLACRTQSKPAPPVCHTQPLSMLQSRPNRVLLGSFEGTTSFSCAKLIAVLVDAAQTGTVQNSENEHHFSEVCLRCGSFSRLHQPCHVVTVTGHLLAMVSACI